jgi:hypothetical protein
VLLIACSSLDVKNVIGTAAWMWHETPEKRGKMIAVPASAASAVVRPKRSAVQLACHPFLLLHIRLNTWIAAVHGFVLLILTHHLQAA